MLPALPTLNTAAAAAGEKTLIYDDAHLLSETDAAELNAMASKYGAERETDIIVYTTNNPESKDTKEITEDFYDEHGPGYDKAHGNAVILTVDISNRDTYLAGFYKAEEMLDDGRLDKITSKISPYLSEGNYKQAFSTYIMTAYRYMGYKPGVNPDNIVFKLWFQVLAALVIGGGVVGTMAYRSGGRVTIHRGTYEDAEKSGVLDRQDQYIRTTVTKRKIERNQGGGSGFGGGGGGTTKGGHSHSGSRGSF
ncbi:TPM domain-containing protein [Paenibacillus sp. JX-17]|uniref:TPM domain-containing protein n=1 Tax=Paenibacillus lacisoli TaxID=3064525 RepID=A0ABT9CGZ5_9BACL|nr:TPM domain-containing protein [Paenibacillus sp. JX-17]MDO7908541.1 TPM domain-containing protein [Paenibacillus sp. JX-17]